MDLIEGYKKTTLIFWEDPVTSFEQFAALGGILIGTSFVNSLLQSLAEGQVRIHPNKYIFTFVYLYILFYFIFGKDFFLYSKNTLKFFRLLLLQIFITALCIGMIFSFDQSTYFSLELVAVSSFLSSIVFILNAVRFKRRIDNPLSIIVVELSLNLFAIVIVYCCILPN